VISILHAMKMFSTLRFAIYILLLVVINTVVYGQAGIVTQRTAPTGIVNFGEGTFSGWSKENFVDGYVRKQGEGLFVFPVGHNAVYAPFATLGDGTDGAFYSVDPNIASAANCSAGGPFATTSMENRLKIVSSEFFWDVNSTKTSKLTLSWSDGNQIANLAPEDFSKITIVGWDGLQWISIPSVVDNTSLFGTASSLTSGSVTSQSEFRLDQYQVYTLASLPSSALPVKLVNFTGNNVEKRANLLWITTEEINVDRFVVQTSLDTKSWRDIGTIFPIAEQGQKSKKYSFVQDNPSDGVNYYRLMMLDLDETFAYSNIITLQFNVEHQITVYPNPVSDKLFIKTDASQRVSNVTFHNNMGLFQFALDKDISTGIDVKHLDRGVYFITITTVDGNQEVHKVLISK
jgi:hypothetical protein